ncbi:hypothetical protein D3C83_143760 [compost metagenome]
MVGIEGITTQQLAGALCVFIAAWLAVFLVGCVDAGDESLGLRTRFFRRQAFFL